MPRVHRVKHARRKHGTCGACGKELVAGEPYLWWKFRYGGKRFRCPEHPPKPEDLTQSPYRQAAIVAMRSAEEAIGAAEDLDGIAEALTNCAESFRSEIAEPLREGVENKRQYFGYDVGEEEETRADDAEQFADDLENAADEIRGMEEDELEDAQERASDALAESPE